MKWTQAELISRTVEAGECWIWQGAINGSGYGIVGFGEGKPGNQLVHRLAYKLWFGDPYDKQVLHTCDTPPCINPHHLFLGTHRDNMQDASRKGRIAGSKKTHCPLGHPYSGDNLVIDTDGHRRCLVCRRAADMRSYFRKKARLAGQS